MNLFQDTFLVWTQIDDTVRSALNISIESIEKVDRYFVLHNDIERVRFQVVFIGQTFDFSETKINVRFVQLKLLGVIINVLSSDVQLNQIKVMDRSFSRHER